MKFWKLSTICIIFCLVILIQVVNKYEVQDFKHTQNKEEYFDGPGEFIKFHRSIRTPSDADAPQYTPGFLVMESEKATLAAFSNQKNARTQNNGVIEWKERGPVNVPGRTRGLLVDPADPTKNTWLAGSAGGGVWKTTNAGTSWTLITPTLSNLATTVLAMADSNPNVIYVGTGEGFGNLDGINGNGMFKSVNRGQTWSYLPSTSNFDDINRAIVDPANENVVIVASNSGIYRTTNGGSAWTKVSSRLGIQDLDATPGNFAIQYATQNRVGVIKSTDAGLTWNLANAGLGSVLRIETAVSPVKTNRLFASCEVSPTSSKLFMSDDAGQTWSLVNVKLTTADLNFLNGQGWYDNTIACDPFNADVIYFGGVDLFQLKLESGSATTGFYSIEEAGTQSFVALTSFGSATNGNFDTGTAAGNSTVEIRFGPGKSQKAHRFLVPVNRTIGVAAADYSYQNYVTVPFEVWDVTNNRQLMASFRDQGRDGTFNLINNNTDNSMATLQSREYLYINNVTYDGSAPNASIAVNGGHEFSEMYFIWPVLAAGGTWPPTINGTIRFKFEAQQKLNATTQFITDGRGDYGNPNKNSIVHVDHHNLVMIPMGATTYKILNANDGGVFISNTSSTPGINNGDWIFAGRTYNTSQFYGADKRPGFDEYFGGMQDNGTWKSPQSVVATENTDYNFNIGGDGFEVLWNNLDDKKLIGGFQFNGFRRSIDGGISWAIATAGLSGDSPFISKLANSRENPETIFTITSAGVFRSNNFGASWILSPILTNWGGSSSFADVEVSRANANIVWGGSGMNTAGSSARNLFVSTNGGTSFNPTVNYSLTPLGGITKLASHPTQQNTAYALFSFAGKPKVLRTTDLGQTWNDISGFNAGSISSNGFPDVAVYCLYVRTDDTNIIWAGTEIGIVESLDNGLSWNLIADFPKVSVWDMKGVDDKIVIATHGRGIWTAKVNAIQTSPIQMPSIVAAGTSPQSDFVVKILLQESYDSLQVYINNQKIGTQKLIAGEYLVKIKNAPVGDNTVRLVGFKDAAPFSSPTFTGKKMALKSPYQSQYATVFKTADDFLLDKFFLINFGTSNQSLQTAHPYLLNTEATALLLQPIIVSATNSTFFYQDVALVQPSANGVTFGQPNFRDFVVVEGTKDGLNWIPLRDGYNASFNAGWLSAYNSSVPTGTPSLSIDQTIDLKNKFKATDTLLFRFRLKSNADVTTGWGWSIDNLYIQQTPTGIEPKNVVTDFNVYPNPTDGKATISYFLTEPVDVSLLVHDETGRAISNDFLGKQPSGEYKKEVTFESSLRGIYFVRLKFGNREKVVKLLVK